jgi:hypothetical protein
MFFSRPFTRLTNAFWQEAGQPKGRMCSAARLLLFLPHSDNLASILRDAIRRGGGGLIELKQMGSADAPLVVHRLHSGRHHQRRYCGTGEVQQQAGPIGSGHTCIAPAYWPVLVLPYVNRWRG